MTPKPTIEDEPSLSETNAQYAMLQQAQAAASAVQTETAGSARQEAPVQTTDLITSDATD